MLSDGRDAEDRRLVGCFCDVNSLHIFVMGDGTPATNTRSWSAIQGGRLLEDLVSGEVVRLVTHCEVKCVCDC